MWTSIYFALIAALCFSGCSLFHRYYYSSFFVSGPSMQPTLNGGSSSGNSGEADFGIIDVSEYAKRNIRRFNILTTYYPWDGKDYAEYSRTPVELKKTCETKIKRVLGMPGETLRTINGNIYISETAKIQNTITTSKTYKIGTTSTGEVGDYYNSYMGFYNSPYEYFFNIIQNYDDGLDFSFEKAGSANGYYLYYTLLDEEGVATKIYLNVLTDNESAFRFSKDMTGSTVWSFESKHKSLSVELTGHDDAELDGKYVLGAVKRNWSVDYLTNFRMYKLSDIPSDVKPVHLLSRDDSKTIVYSSELIPNCPYENHLLPFKQEFNDQPHSIKDINEVNLPEDCYWMQGDHWSNSNDCVNVINGLGNVARPIYTYCIEGVLVAIEGTCTITSNENGEKVCVNHKYSIPRYL